MELLGTLFRGLVIGFSIAAPVGPVGVLCIRRTLANGRSAGFLSGLGAASADALYCCVAAFGLTSVSGFLVDQQLLLRSVGGAFLLYLGFRIFRERPDERQAAISGTSYGGLKGVLLDVLAYAHQPLDNPFLRCDLRRIGFG